MKKNKSDITFALRCFKNGKRVKTNQLTKKEARCFRVAAVHMTNYLNEAYKLQELP